MNRTIFTKTCTTWRPKAEPLVDLNSCPSAGENDDQSLNPTSSFGCFFGEGAMRRTRGCLGNTPFFWQFVNDAHGTAGWLKRVVSLGCQYLRRIRPLVDGRHSLPLFFASGRPNHGRCLRPVLTVLPLPFTRHLDQSEGVAKRRTRASGGESSRGLFVFPSALGGQSSAQGPAQSIGVSSVGYVQFVAHTVGYAAMS